MKTNLKTLWAAAALSLACLTQTGTLQADCYANSCDSCEQDCCGSFFAGVDWLYWEASATGLSYARTFDTSKRLSANAQNDGLKAVSELLEVSSCSRTKNPDFSWDSGVRLFAGWRSANDCWDATVRWTHFCNSSHGSHSIFDGVYAAPTWGASENDPLFSAGFIVPTRQKLSNKWSLDLNLVDFELGKEFNMCRCLALRPHIGLRYAKINQKVKTKLSQLLAAETNEGFETRGDVSMNNNFKGTGIRGGFDTNWCFSDCFGVYGNAAASLIYGRFSLNQTSNNDTTAEALASVHTYDIKQTDHVRTLAPATDLGIGVYYKSCCECATFTIKLGWELQHFWGQNRFQRFDNKWFQQLVYGDDSFNLPKAQQFWDYYAKDNSSKGDLALQGLTLSFMADF